METKPNWSYALRGNETVKKTLLNLFFKSCCIPFLAAEAVQTDGAASSYFVFSFFELIWYGESLDKTFS